MSMKQAKLQQARETRDMSAKLATAVLLPTYPCPVAVFTVSRCDTPTWNAQLVTPMTKFGKDHDLHPFVRIRVLYHSPSHGAQIPGVAISAPLGTDCRLKDVGFVRQVQGVSTLIDAHSLRAGLLSVLTEHLRCHIPIFQTLPTNVAILLTDVPSTLPKDDRLVVDRHSFQKLTDRGVMLLFICINSRDLWNMPTEAGKFPSLTVTNKFMAAGLAGHCRCHGWVYLDNRSITTDRHGSSVVHLANLPDATRIHRRRTLSKLTLAHPCLPSLLVCRQGNSMQWMWHLPTSTATTTATPDVTLSNIDDIAPHLRALLRDFAQARRSLNRSSAPGYDAWCAARIQTWSNDLLDCLCSPTVCAVRQLLFGAAAQHSERLYQLAVTDWVELCGSLLVSLLDQGDATAKAYVLQVSRQEYKRWGMTVDGLVYMTDLLNSSAGCTLVAGRLVQPILGSGGRVHVSSIPGLALKVTLEQLQKNLSQQTKMSSVQYATTRKRLHRSTKRVLYWYVKSDLVMGRRNVTEDDMLDEADKVSMAVFLERHAGRCLTSLIKGWHGGTLNNDARFRLMSIFYPYVKKEEIVSALCVRLQPQWTEAGNSFEKRLEVTTRLKTMTGRRYHRADYLREWCLQPFHTPHQCVYSSLHPGGVVGK
jgi:hypothetical protein